MRGRWINVTSKSNGLNIRAKVTDGDIIFPLSAKETFVTVESALTKLVFIEDQARNWKVHLAQEKGLSIDSDSIAINTPDLIEYRIMATGANIF